MFDSNFNDISFRDVNSFVEHLDRFNAEPEVVLSDKDIKAVKASKKTWADVYAIEDEE